jgi:hypothetical protein
VCKGNHFFAKKRHNYKKSERKKLSRCSHRAAALIILPWETLLGTSP